MTKNWKKNMMAADNLVTMPWFLANSAEMRALKDGFDLAVTTFPVEPHVHRIVRVVETESELVVEAVAGAIFRIFDEKTGTFLLYGIFG